MDLIPADAEWTAGVQAGPTIELKLVGALADEGFVEGYGSTFGGVDSHRDTIQPGAFTETLKAHNAAQTAPAMLWSHNQAEPIGRWLAMGEDPYGLRVQGQINRSTPAGQKAYSHLKAGDVTGLSIGYALKPNGYKHTPNGRLLTNVHLHEVSVVAVPSDPRARITEVKSLQSRAELEDLLREQGLARGAARKIASAGWAALSGEPTPQPASPDLSLALKALDRNLLNLKGLGR